MELPTLRTGRLLLRGFSLADAPASGSVRPAVHPGFAVPGFRSGPATNP